MTNVEMYRAKVEELIRQADITTVSARNIRKKIEALTNTSLDNVKREFDELVMEIYGKITDDIERAVLNGNQSLASNNTHHQQQNQPPVQKAPAAPQAQGFSLALPPTSYVPPPPKPKPKPKTAPTPVKHVPDDDDDIDSEDSYSSVEESSGRASKKAKTSSSGSSKKASTKAKPKAKSKSSKKDDDDKPKKKRKQPVNEDGTPKVNNFTRPMIISDTLYNIIGHYGTVGPSGRVEMSRPEVVKHIWAYIKENNLQAENDKRIINCDNKLKTLFEQDQVNCFSMNKFFGSHLSKPEEKGITPLI